MRKTLLIPNRRQFVTAGMGAAALLAAPSILRAAAWPTKSIRVLAGFAAGGQTDQFARAYGDYIGREVGQTVVVENKTGAGGAVAAMELKRSAPDGYTWMVSNTTTYMLNSTFIKDIQYDAAKDFTLVSMMPTGSLPLVVSNKIGAKNLKDFIDYAKKTGNVNVGTYAAGSFAHIIIAELNKQYGLKMNAVHYRGEAPMWTDLAGGAIDAGIGSYAASLVVLQSNKGNAVAVTRRRIDAMPDVATFQEQGANSRGFSLLSFQGCAVPAQTPPEIVAKLSDLFVAAGKSDRVRALIKSQGIDEAAMSATASQAVFKEEAPIWAKLAASLDLQPQ